MHIHELMEQEGWELVERANWIAVRTGSAEFKKIAPQGRIGKIIGSHFYVTPPALAMVTERLIISAHGKPEWIASTNAASGRKYMGFDTSGVPEEMLILFVQRFHAALKDLEQELATANRAI